MPNRGASELAERLWEAGPVRKDVHALARESESLGNVGGDNQLCSGVEAQVRKASSALDLKHLQGSNPADPNLENRLEVGSQLRDLLSWRSLWYASFR